VPPAPQALGLALQLAPLNATHNIWHILSIPSPLSPAHLAGLLPHSDYILGTPSGTLRGEAALGELVEDHLNRTLVIWVYNSEFDVVREVELIPRRGWGGEGALGAVLGFGALHRLPVGLGEEIQGPGEKMFEAEHRTSMEKAPALEYGNFMVPAESKAPMQAQPPPFMSPSVAPQPMISPNTPFRGNLAQEASTTQSRKSRHRGGPPPSRAFDDMFEEGTKKSQEQDFVPSRKGTPVAPPPKAGGLEGASAPGLHESHPNPSPPSATGEDLGEPGNAEVT
jgi:GRASP55/65 PDZ-like domain